MTDQSQTADEQPTAAPTEQQPTARPDGSAEAPFPAPPMGPPTPDAAAAAAAAGAASSSDRPEVAIGAAFAGGFVLALILKRLAR